MSMARIVCWLHFVSIQHFKDRPLSRTVRMTSGGFRVKSATVKVTGNCGLPSTPSCSSRPIVYLGNPARHDLLQLVPSHSSFLVTNMRTGIRNIGYQTLWTLRKTNAPCQSTRQEFFNRVVSGKLCKCATWAEIQSMCGIEQPDVKAVFQKVVLNDCHRGQSCRYVLQRHAPV